MEEMSWRQKSKELWLKEVDRNTRFFHQMANTHQRINHISRIKVNGSWVTKEEDIKEAVGNIFKKPLSVERGWRPPVFDLGF